MSRKNLDFFKSTVERLIANAVQSGRELQVWYGERQGDHEHAFAIQMNTPQNSSSVRNIFRLMSTPARRCITDAQYEEKLKA